LLGGIPNFIHVGHDNIAILPQFGVVHKVDTAVVEASFVVATIEDVDVR
jgi:hypothetical protein